MNSHPYLAWFVSLCVLLVAGGSGLSHAQTQTTDPGFDPPERVGRLSAIEGDVSAWDESQQTWQPAQINLPVTSRSAFLTGRGSRAEVTVGSAALRLDADTQVNLLRLDDGGTDLDVPRGTASIRLRAPADPAWQVAVRNGLISLSSPGNYRLDVDPVRGMLVTTVFEGHAEIEGAGTRTRLVQGQQSSFDMGTLRQIGMNALVRSPLDDWAARRDREQDRLQTWRYVSPEMTGADALDAAGDWRTDPEYGAVWFPNTVPAGWAPYSTGRWVWMPPWGWNWVDDAPWGFAPFHYGRWVTVGNSWGWVPGPYVRRPSYAPALVGFHGNGGRVSFAPPFGSARNGWSGAGGQYGPIAGWFPLAPGEAWYPPYRASGGYLQNLNRGHAPLRAQFDGTDAGQRYRWAQVPHASTRVPQSALSGSGSVWSHRLPAPGSGAIPAMPLPAAPAWARPGDRGDARRPDPWVRPGERGDRPWDRGERPGERPDRPAVRVYRSERAPRSDWTAGRGWNERSNGTDPGNGSARWTSPMPVPPPQGQPYGGYARPDRPSRQFPPASVSPPAAPVMALPAPPAPIGPPPGRPAYAGPPSPSYSPPVQQPRPAPPPPENRGDAGRHGRWGDPAGGQRGGGHHQR